MSLPPRDLVMDVSIESKIRLIYYFCRMQLPQAQLSLVRFRDHVERMRGLYQDKGNDAQWGLFLQGLHSLDTYLAAACLENDQPSWELLMFDARVSRDGSTLMDALRRRAVRLHPGKAKEQDEAIDSFWGFLLAGEVEGSPPVLQRYDGHRPLVPWLVRVFHNWQVSKLRQRRVETEDIYGDDFLPAPETPASDERWHRAFCEAATRWLQQLAEKDLILLGLLWRYRVNQRTAAGVLRIHEGTISRRIAHLAEDCKRFVASQMRQADWTGDDLTSLLKSEMASILLDEPRLSIDHLARVLRAKGESISLELLSSDGQLNRGA